MRTEQFAEDFSRWVNMMWRVIAGVVGVGASLIGLVVTWTDIPLSSPRTVESLAWFGIGMAAIVGSKVMWRGK